jgi:hypothetical protein
MKPRNKLLKHEFVEFIPDILERDTIYISIPFATASHLCCCGCGLKVVTPISPRGWKLIFDGETISLYPSIGNHQFPCSSHYWIRESRVVWAESLKQGKHITGKQKPKKRNFLGFIFRKKSMDNYFTF